MNKRVLILADVGIVILGALAYYMRGRRASQPAPGGDPCSGVVDADAGYPIRMTRCRQKVCAAAGGSVASICECINRYKPNAAAAAVCCTNNGGATCADGSWLGIF